MHAILTIADLQPESGGPSRTVPALATALANLGVNVNLITLSRKNVVTQPIIPAHERIRTVFVPCRSNISKLTGAGGKFRAAVIEVCRSRRDAIVHDNGLWLGTNHGAASAAWATGTPLLISPRGMLTSWSLQHKGWKKKIAWRLYQQQDLNNARVLHATSRAEAGDFRAVGLLQPIAMIPNGVELPPEGALTRNHGDTAVKTLLFVSRIHPKKGLLNLVQAWEVAKPSGWKVVVAGTDEGGHLAEVKAEAERQKVSAAFDFVGPIEGKAKWSLYQEADAFVLPSHSENFGLVVAEALACGVPVLTTRGTPWEELLTHRCGWWVEPSVDGLVEGLRKSTGCSDAERREMGARGRRLVQEKYTWAGVAAQMKSVYEWMLNKGPKPICIID